MHKRNFCDICLMFLQSHDQRFEETGRTSPTDRLREGFAPTTIQIGVGNTIATWLTNPDGISHDFSIPDPGIKRVLTRKSTSLVVITP